MIVSWKATLLRHTLGGYSNTYSTDSTAAVHVLEKTENAMYCIIDVDGGAKVPLLVTTVDMCNLIVVCYFSCAQRKCHVYVHA